MAKYKVSHFQEDNSIAEWSIEAADLSDAQQIVLDQENYKISLEEAIDYSLYYQRSSRYKGVKIGKSGLLFQNFGCFVHCLAFMAKKDPLDVLKLLVENGGINASGLVVSDRAAELLGLDMLKGDDKYIFNKMNDINYMPKFNCIKEVLLAKSQHFTVRLIDKDGKRSIFDPWTGKIQPINFYTFKSYRLFKVK